MGQRFSWKGWKMFAEAIQGFAEALPLIGFGALGGYFLDHFLSGRRRRKDARYIETLESFSGFLGAAANSAQFNTGQILAEAAMWKARIDLVASQETISAVTRFMNGKPTDLDRDEQVSSMKDQMRQKLESLR